MKGVDHKCVERKMDEKLWGEAGAIGGKVTPLFFLEMVVKKKIY